MGHFDVTLVDDEAVASVMDVCGDVEYEVGVLYIPAPHFAFAAWPKNRTATTDCPTWAFDSLDGKNVVWEGDHEQFDRFVFEGESFALIDVMGVALNIEPIPEYDWEFKSCAHYAQSLWLGLGIAETSALGDFLVDRIVTDSRFPELARSKTGAGILFFVLGDEAVKDYVTELVYSQLDIGTTAHPVEGAMPASEFGSDKWRRHLTGKCSSGEYRVYLAITHVPLIVAASTSGSECGGFYFEAYYNTESSKFEKEALPGSLEKVQDRLAAYGEADCLIELGSYPFSSISLAFDTADDGSGQEVTDLLSSNSGVFLKNFAMNLGYHSPSSLTVKVSECLLKLDPTLLEGLRDDDHVSGICKEAVSDMELMEWFVETLSGETYLAGTSSVAPYDCTD